MGPGLRALTPHVATLRPIGGFYLLILGMSFLLLPEGTVGISLQPRWLLGACLLGSGLATLWLAITRLPRRAAFAAMMLASLPPLGVALAYLLLGLLPAAATLGFLSLALLLAPLAPPLVPGAPHRPDALGLAFGGAVLVQGLEIAARPGGPSSLPALIGLPAAPVALALILTGLAVVVAQLSRAAPAALRWAAHIACGATVIGLQSAVALAIGPLYWVLGAATMLRGITILLLPWLTQRAARIDEAAFRPRVALALITAAIVPIGIALPVLLATIDQQDPTLVAARQVAFGSTLLVMLGASVGGWWLAGSLSAPLTRLARGVDQIAAGQRGVLPQRGVTEVVTLSHAVSQMAQSLEARADERALLLERERAAHARAQEAVQARDTFLSVAAHELKTPLTSLLGNAQLLARRTAQAGTLNERDQRAIARIAEQAGRLSQLISALLDVSRLETGQLHVTRAPMDLVALTRRVCAEIEPTLQRHRLVCELPDAPVLVDGDELRLWQALENLIGNAVKYSPAGGQVVLQLALEPGWATLAVRDEGLGIPAAAQGQLFQRFFRAPNAETQQIAGMGVGLFVVREIVALHGGSIDVQSAEGQGSTFHLRLPLLEQPVHAAD